MACLRVAHPGGSVAAPAHRSNRIPGDALGRPISSADMDPGLPRDVVRVAVRCCRWLRVPIAGGSAAASLHLLRGLFPARAPGIGPGWPTTGVLDLPRRGTDRGAGNRIRATLWRPR